MKRMLCPNCYTYNRTTQFVCTHCETDIHAVEEIHLDRAGFKEHQCQLRRQHADAIIDFLRNDYYGDQAYYWHTLEPVTASEAIIKPTTYRFAWFYYMSIMASLALALVYLWFSEVNFQMATTLILVVTPALFSLMGGTFKNMKMPCDITLDPQAIRLGKQTVPWHKIHFMGIKKNDRTGLSQVQFEIWHGDDLAVTQMLLKENARTAAFVKQLKGCAQQHQVTFAELIANGHVTTV